MEQKISSGYDEVRRCHWVTKNSEILKIRDLYRESCLGFVPENAAKMGDKGINKISSNKAMMLIGPVIVYSFMQLPTDDRPSGRCSRNNECVTLAERPWRHI
ncbi:hypothetical protein F3Y22_tig00112864pilonHSYRG00162 [Hibiscus syriacus]|uniref:Uncharacterized protein n=1 Tax=Hibiscus syriacus TaxID=106335 RepID=A0A6A2WSQ0_HIBSY|nr:hypothetical protein F3Y22_tig00112864pilonHSYRG00162 [Hibiscus syriacus]